MKRKFKTLILTIPRWLYHFWRRQKAKRGKIKIDLGPGEIPKRGYLSVDLYGEADIKANATSLPFPNESIEEIYASHLLEHFSHRQTLEVLGEWLRVLKPGGKLEVIVPNLEWLLKNWLATPEEKRWGWNLQTIFGLQTHEGEYHKTGFTPKRLKFLLKEAGFNNIEVETKWDKVHNVESIYCQAKKL